VYSRGLIFYSFFDITAEITQKIAFHMKLSAYNVSEAQVHDARISPILHSLVTMAMAARSRANFKKKLLLDDFSETRVLPSVSS